MINPGRTLFDGYPKPGEPTKFNFAEPNWPALSDPGRGKNKTLDAFLKRYGSRESDVEIGIKVRELWSNLTDIVLSIDKPDSLKEMARVAEILETLCHLPSTGRSKKPSLFISYRSTDRRLANYLRRYAISLGKNVWMDEYDPWLVATKKSPISAQLKSLLIAIVIEIALLNCTHLAVVHTLHTSGSVWVPYELGRVKQRLLTSDNAAFWYQGTRMPAYSYLVDRFHRPTQWNDLQAWIGKI